MFSLTIEQIKRNFCIVNSILIMALYNVQSQMIPQTIYVLNSPKIRISLSSFTYSKNCEKSIFIVILVLQWFLDFKSMEVSKFCFGCNIFSCVLKVHQCGVKNLPISLSSYKNNMLKIWY